MLIISKNHTKIYKGSTHQNKTMFIDQIKTTILLAGLTFLLLTFGFAIGGTTGLTIALLLTATMNIVSYWYSDKLVLKMHKAKPADHAMFEELHDIVKNIATT